jgi:hypothetical protein
MVVGSTNDLNPESLICVRRKGNFARCVLLTGKKCASGGRVLLV